jgi:hypothetical protein
VLCPKWFRAESEFVLFHYVQYVTKVVGPLSLIICCGGMEDSKRGKHGTYLSILEIGSFTADAGSVHPVHG